MPKKGRSRKARRTGTPIGENEATSDTEVVEEAYEVECVVDHRERRGGTEYKVRWRGWSPQFDEWLHYTKMDCPEAIKEYWEKVEEKRRSKEASLARKRERTSSRTSLQSEITPPTKRRTLLTSPPDRGATDECRSRSTSPPLIAYLPTTPSSKSTENTNTLTHGSQDDAKKEQNDAISSDAVSGAKQLVRDGDVDSQNDLANVQNTTSSASSSLDSGQTPSPRKSIPLPPILPQRKPLPSLSNSGTSLAISVSPSGTNNVGSSDRSTVVLTNASSSGAAPVRDDSQCDSEQMAKSRSEQGCEAKKLEPVVKEKRFVRPHGFERGLTVERIHGFIQRAGLLFAVVQFKNCDIVEILATRIVEHYEPMALIRGFEEHRIRSRRNRLLASPASSQSVHS